MGKRDEYLKDAVHSGTGPDGREYQWRAATMGDTASALKTVPHLLLEVKASENGDGSEVMKLKKLDMVLGNREYNEAILRLCVISPRLIDNEADPDEDAVLLWTVRDDVKEWLIDQIERASKIRGEEADRARSFRGESDELQAPRVDGGDVRSEAVGSVSG